jgi:hypothetical protein
MCLSATFFLEEPGKNRALPLKAPLTTAEAVVAAAIRALCYRISRSMTSMAISRAMASALIAFDIATSFLRGTAPERPEEERMSRQHI